MPSQLLNRLNPFYDQTPASRVMAAQNGAAPAPHWASRTWGAAMNPIQTIMIHETSGWPSFASAPNFVDQYTCRVAVNQGIGPQFFVDPNGTAFRLIDMVPTRRLTWHGGFLNGTSVGIENGDAGDNPDVNFPANHLWNRTAKDAAHPANEDLPGLKAFLLLHPGGDQDAVLLWFATAAYTGPGDVNHLGNFLGMLFTDAQYDGLARLVRYLLEELALPRNFALLPYEERNTNQNDVTILRRILLADERTDMLARAAGQNSAADFQNLTPALQTWYRGLVTHRVPADHIRGKVHNSAWSNFFEDSGGHSRGFRGIISHALPGAISINADGSDQGDHPCPGPYFDWHRFSRQVWDWWWYPFDFTGAPLAPSTVRRPYAQARRSTPLVEYFYDAPGQPADYNGLRVVLSLSDRFPLANDVPVYAVANGVLVAAKIPIASDPNLGGFVLTRHEVYWQANGNRIDYDTPPTYVWSLITFLSNASAVLTTLSLDNPDWLNRTIMRVVQCESAVQFRASHPSPTLETGWNHQPSSPGPRLTTGQQIEWDATSYRRYINDLQAGSVVLFPLESNPAPTPVRVILGDFLGTPGPMPNNQNGVQVEIFSVDQLNVPGAAQRVLSWQGQQWWTDATAAIRHEDEVAKDLPANGMVWQYSMTNFLTWLNELTWTSEWDKFGVVDAAGAAVPKPARPRTRVTV
jgi:N-acetylmuramoyl-L-alanine amidase